MAFTSVQNNKKQIVKGPILKQQEGNGKLLLRGCYLVHMERSPGVLETMEMEFITNTKYSPNYLKTIVIHSMFRNSKSYMTLFKYFPLFGSTGTVFVHIMLHQGTN